jgi:hypothetical protein
MRSSWLNFFSKSSRPYVRGLLTMPLTSTDQGKVGKDSASLATASLSVENS